MNDVSYISLKIRKPQLAVNPITHECRFRPAQSCHLSLAADAIIGKLAPRFHGPCQIIHRVGANMFKVKEPHRTPVHVKDMKFYCSLGWKVEVSYNTSCLWKHSAVFLNVWYRGMWQAILLPDPHAQWALCRDYCTSYLRCALTVEWWIISLALSVAFPLNYLLLQTPPPQLTPMVTPLPSLQFTARHVSYFWC